MQGQVNARGVTSPELKAVADVANAAMPKAGGTFTGAVDAAAAGQNPATSLLRNSKLVAAEANPTVNGEIFWVYE